MMRVGTIGFLSLWLVACSNEDHAVALNALEDGPPPPTLSGVAVPDCRDASDCAALALDACEVARCLPDGTCDVAAADDGASCDDGNPCTATGTCASGACVAGAPDDGACDDEDPCTTESSCAGGVCVGAGELACDDGDPCTDDVCEPGVGCAGVARTCPDPAGIPCDRGVCDPATGACTTGPRADGDACDDGLSCSVGATCHQGACVGFVSPQCDDDNPCTVDFCSASGCDHNPLAGDCDDGDACTTGDACAEGECVGALMACDDDDPCTSDACVVGSCIFTPIEDCVPPSPGCEDKLDGEACDDDDATTVADLCVASVCRGFKIIHTSAASAGEGRRLRRVDRHAGHWVTAVEVYDAADGAGGVLADISAAGAITAFGGTRQPARFTAVHRGFAVDDAGVLWTFVDGQWSDEQPLRAALDESGVGDIHGVWSYEDGNGAVRLWVVGEGSFGGPWVRRCAASSPIAEDATCNAQSVLIAEDPVLRAIAGDVSCAGATCTASLVAPGDLFQATGSDGVPRWFNDVYSHNGTAGGSWQVAAFDPGQSRMFSNDAAAVAPGRFVVVGGYGYLRTNSPSGLWDLNPETVVETQEKHHFEGAWSGGGVVVVAGWSTTSTSGAGPRRLEILVAPSGADLSAPASWHRHELGTVAGDGTGLLDVWGDGGDWMLVGAERSPSDGPLTGLVYHREP